MSSNRIFKLLALLLIAGSCTGNKFKGENKAAQQEKAVEQPETPQTATIAEESPTPILSKIPQNIAVENISDLVIDAKFQGGFESKSLSPQEENHLWIATAAGEVQHLRLENGVVKGKKVWTGATPVSGTRTYVLEGGAAVLAKNGGEFYFLHDGVAEGAINKDPLGANYFKMAGVGANDRSCVVSYKRDGKRFLGIAYGLGFFVEIEQANVAPFGPIFAQAKPPIKVTELQWGYSCYIDQARLYYYSQYFKGSTVGLDLKTMLPLDLNKAPNAAFVSTNIPALTIGPKAVGDGATSNGSYAMSGDRLGNVFNATDYYTLSYEPKNAMVWGSSGTNLSIYPHDCLYKTAVCKGFATYNLMEKIGVGLGPLSALGDGRMAGMVRNVGDVYLIKLKVPNDATKDIEAVKIAEKVGGGGDPYMYTDFTGATLYLSNSLNEFDFTKSATYVPNLPVRQISWTWLQGAGMTDEWQNIKAEIRCYSDDTAKGDFQEFQVQLKPKAIQYLNISSCNGKGVKKAEVRLTQLGNSASLMGVEKIQVTIFQ